MPIYEYHCEDCNSDFIVPATLAEKETGLDIVCSFCGSRKVKQLFSGISLKKGKNRPASNEGCMPGCSCGK